VRSSTRRSRSRLASSWVDRRRTAPRRIIISCPGSNARALSSSSPLPRGSGVAARGARRRRRRDRGSKRRARRVHDALPRPCVQRGRSLGRALPPSTARGPLDGVPLAVKDLYDTEGVRTTYGSAIFRDHVPRATPRRCDAPAPPARSSSARRRRTSSPGVSARSTARWERPGTRGIPRVSREGRAAAPRSPSPPISSRSRSHRHRRLDPDPGGVLRGRRAQADLRCVSRSGIFPLAHSLDHAGPMARTPADAAALLSVIAGPDDADPRRRRPRSPPPWTIDGSLAGVRVGVCPSSSRSRSPRHRERVRGDVRRLGELGATVREVDLPEAASAVEIYARSSAPRRSTPTAARLYPRGQTTTATTSAAGSSRNRGDPVDYLEASVERERLRAGFRRVFGEVDLLVSPVARARRSRSTRTRSRTSASG